MSRVNFDLGGILVQHQPPSKTAYKILQELENRPAQDFDNIEFIHELVDLLVACFPFVHMDDWELQDVSDGYRLSGHPGRDFALTITVHAETSHSRINDHVNQTFEDINLVNSDWSSFIAWLSYAREWYDKLPHERQFFEFVGTNFNRTDSIPNLLGPPLEVRSHMWIEANERQNAIRHVDVYREPKSEWVHLPPQWPLADAIRTGLIKPLVGFDLESVSSPIGKRIIDPAIFNPQAPASWNPLPVKKPTKGTWVKNVGVVLDEVKEDPAILNLDSLDFELKHYVATEQWVKEAAAARDLLTSRVIDGKPKTDPTTEGKNG